MLRLAPLIAILAALPAARAEAAAPKNTCIDCHEDLLGAAEGDVHRAAGFSCVDCHHGDPTKDDQEKAMDPAKGFVGIPKAGAAARMPVTPASPAVASARSPSRVRMAKASGL